ncbi:DMT family transporter [Streptomyces sp. A7024]|uniref:DMT family transporter n=1 Tax=Streptomyces coryli TaxID=1128680 RepID=A0A6G4U4B2_9ACTN|nr:DMT family transporter [Streptomyces coryli]NGN66127.1 DMT family transporter [Streptomyces coryli]
MPPVLLVIAGSACISLSAMFVKLSGVGAGTAAFLRCALALIALVPLAVVEVRRRGRLPRRVVALDVVAGLLLGVDFVFWAAAIRDVGASITTVLLNIQVVVFPVLARAFTGAPLSARFYATAPALLAGVALASGAIGDPEPGSSPVTGVLYGSAAGVAFAGYLLLTRQGGGSRGYVALPVTAATASAAVAAGILGALWTGIDLTPGAEAYGWLGLMTLLGQVLALLLITPALPLLSPATGGSLLLLQPVLAMAAGVAFLGERPTWTQYAGCVLVIAAVWGTTRAGRPSGPVREPSVSADR